MDDIFHFAGQPSPRNKQKQQQYYSDAEAEDTQSTFSIQTAPVKKSTFSTSFKSAFQVNTGYATDDVSSDGEGSSHSSHFFSKNKVSKFNNLSTQQPNGDEGLEDELESLSPPKPLKEKKPSIAHDKKNLLHAVQEQKFNFSMEMIKKDQNSSASPISREHKQRIQKPQKLYDSDADSKKISTKNQVLDNLKHHPFRHLIFSNVIQEGSFKKHLSLTYRGLVYASKCLKGPSEKFLQSKQVSVDRPKNSKGKTLLLDLDETLIHSCSLREHPDHIIIAQNEKGDESKIGLKVRPYCLEFLQKLSELWDIFIFTASSPSYAQAIVDFLDPNKAVISGILNRSNCMETKNGFYIKDLRIIKDSNLRSTVLVDNLSHSFGFQPDNGIPIIEWHNDKADSELKHLSNYLIQAAACEDVRQFNRQYLKLHELITFESEELGI